MKVGLDLRLHAYAPGGISRYARRLAQALATLMPADQLTLLSHRKESDPLVVPGARTRRVWTPPHHPLERWALGAEILPLGLDILHSTDFIPPAWGARRLVVTIHDLNFLHYPDYLTVEARRFYNEQIRWAVARADAILVDSYATQRDLTELLEVPPERVTVAHLAASERFRPLPESVVAEALARYALAAGYVLFVGVWEPRKNLPGLLEAYAMLRADGLTPSLVIVGRPGWLYGDIYTRIQALNLAPYVRFIENPDLDDLVALYNGAAVLVIPSFYEGFGFPALEAMQCGTPVVAADRASLPEVVGEAGLLVDPDDPATIAEALRRLLESPDLRARCREAGFLQARTFSWRATAEKTLEAYRQALGT
ncbi:MAG: glycosyltransferase family 4 protein [Anaerolineae bacterium]|nr:glycosyltransferase family 4 protein [Anaerolineae bacterium]